MEERDRKGIAIHSGPQASREQGDTGREECGLCLDVPPTTC
jgi:hypothetical protein